MREHLYKAFASNKDGKDKIYLNNEWVYGEWVEGYYVALPEEYSHGKDMVYAIFTLDCEHICMGEYKDWGWHEVLPETVCEFTGSYDTNGQRIWEHDIVSGLMDYGPAGFMESAVPIGFDEDCGWQFNYFDKTSMKVIGNVFSQPQFIYKNKLLSVPCRKAD